MSHSSDKPPAQVSRVVVVVHGIRTHAKWYQLMREVMTEDAETKVLPAAYGYFSAFGFLCPFFTREAPLRAVEAQIRDAIRLYPSADLTIVCHSFGTYLVSRILKENPDIRPCRVVLCGAVVDTKFPWSSLAQQDTKVINDVGTKDVWPIFATLFGFGYGPSGTFGFNTTRVCDRFFNFGHSGFFKRSFVQSNWKGLIIHGEEKGGLKFEKQARLGVWASWASHWFAKWALLTALLALCIGLTLWMRLPPRAPHPSEVLELIAERYRGASDYHDTMSFNMNLDCTNYFVRAKGFGELAYRKQPEERFKAEGEVNQILLPGMSFGTHKGAFHFEKGVGVSWDLAPRKAKRVEEGTLLEIIGMNFHGQLLKHILYSAFRPSFLTLQTNTFANSTLKSDSVSLILVKGRQKWRDTNVWFTLKWSEILQRPQDATAHVTNATNYRLHFSAEVDGRLCMRRLRSDFTELTQLLRHEMGSKNAIELFWSGVFDTCTNATFEAHFNPSFAPLSNEHFSTNHIDF